MQPSHLIKVGHVEAEGLQPHFVIRSRPDQTEAKIRKEMGRKTRARFHTCNTDIIITIKSIGNMLYGILYKKKYTGH